MSTDFNTSTNSLHAKEYTSTYELALQQKTSKLSGKVELISGNAADKLQKVVRYDETSLQGMTGLNQQIAQSSIGYDQRWVKGSQYYNSQLLNDIQQLQNMVQNPAGPISQSQTAATLRKMDEVILGALFTNALTGADAGQTTAYTAGNTVAVDVGAGSATGLNLKKLDEVIEKAESNEIVPEEEPLCMVVTEKQMADLRRQVEAMNADYQAGHAVVRDGRGGIQSIKGIELVMIASSRLGKYATDSQLLDGSSYRRCPVFTKKGMALAVWKASKVDVSPRKDIQGQPTQFYVEQYIGATRTDEKRVFEILCSEA